MADVRAKNLSSEKLDSIYNDVEYTKKTFHFIYKWYLIIGGGIVIALLSLAFFSAFF